MSSNHKGDMVQYVPFSSFVHPSFWHALTDIKLNVDKLNESSRQIFGRFTYREDIGAVFEIDGTSFNKIPEQEQLYQNVAGVIINKNTVEDFKNIDKVMLLNTIGKEKWEFIKTNWIKNPSCLLNFYILSFADLKKFHYYYWFAFPTPNKPVSYFSERSKLIKNDFTDQQIVEILNGFKALDTEQQSFFVVDIKEHISVKLLADVITHEKPDLSSLYFAFIDPSKESNPGWPLRLFIAALLQHCPSLHGDIIKVIGLRCNKNGDISNSRIFYFRVPEVVESSDVSGWVGWERNDKGNFGPKLANMSASMCPIKLADASSDLNIKLMKWRLVPDLDVDIMKDTKCLLLGAGTLGCHVARDLLAWGFRHITFLDNGKVSYSNPTRQVLFNFQDCIANKRKAEAASDNLKLILPTVKTKGLAVHIPMPGHPVGEALIEETMTNVKILTDEIIDHDVVFLLLDTREARWLPTLIAAHYGKIVINAALGFDSYLVIRHGTTSSTIDEDSLHKPFIPGGQLGCYFCNDVTAPGNSSKDRTLDQQCTVTRPGVAAVAGALAVEILVALLQHSLRSDAPAPYNLSSESSTDEPQDMAGVLGPIPHSIRGFLHSYQIVLPTYAKFRQCIACSNAVLTKYKEEGNKFLLEVFNSGTYLEKVTGLTEMHLAAEMAQVLTFSDEESDNSQ